MTLEPVKATKSCSNSSSKVQVLILVSSSIPNFEARQAVRRSWGANLPSLWLLVFFIGATTDALLQEKVRVEAQEYGDIAQDLSFYDSYSNLTLKTLSLLSWSQHFCTRATYILKSDEDIFLNVHKLYNLTMCVTEARKTMYTKKKKDKPFSSGQLGGVSTHQSFLEALTDNSCDALTPRKYINYFINSQTHEYESYMFGGYLYNGVKAERNPQSKWYLDPMLYSNDILPPFLSGTSYIITSNLIPHLLEEAKFTSLIQLEDVYISGLVGNNRLNIKLSHLEGWTQFRPWWDDPCIYRELLTSHGFSPSELLSIFQAVNNLSHTACDSFLLNVMKTFTLFVSSIFPRVQYFMW